MGFWAENWDIAILLRYTVSWETAVTVFLSSNRNRWPVFSTVMISAD